MRLRRTTRKKTWWIRIIELQDFRIRVKYGGTSGFIPKLPQIFLYSEFGSGWEAQVKQKSFTYSENEVFYFAGSHFHDFWRVNQKPYTSHRP